MQAPTSSTRCAATATASRASSCVPRGLFYRLFRSLAAVSLEANTGDFRLLDRRALDALLSMRERSRFLRGMSIWVGFTPGLRPLRPRRPLRR